MIVFTNENKRALKRIKGEDTASYKDLAESIGVHYNTLRKIIRSDDEVTITPKVYQKIMNFIASRY